jgi:hypothetical protein
VQPPLVEPSVPVVAPPVTSPPVEVPKPVFEIVDCKAKSYHGLRQGDLAWIGGSIEPNGVVVIRAPGETVAGGTVSGNALPRCEVDVKVDSSDLEIVEKPSRENGFRQVRLRNKSTSPISNIELHWSIK